MLSYLTFWLAFALFSLSPLPTQANLELLDGVVVTTFDVSWFHRAPREFNFSGSLVTAFNFSSPGCSASPIENELNSNITETKIVYLHLPSLSSAGCDTLATLVQSVQQLYVNTSTFGVLLVTFDTEESTGTDNFTPWGDPSVLQAAPFQIAIGPRSSADVLGNYTQSHPSVVIQSDPGPWNNHFKGTAANIYDAILTLVYLIYFSYAFYFHYRTYRARKKCPWPLKIKSWIYVCVQLFLGCQIIHAWLPLYPGVLCMGIFWYSFFFGFIAYTLMLLTWIKVVNGGKKRKTNALSALVVKLIKTFSFIAMIIIFLILTMATVAIPFPHISQIQNAKFGFYCLFPIILVSQAVVFLFYGSRLIKALTTFSMTEEKRTLVRKMSVLMMYTVGCFLVSAFMTVLVILFNDTIAGAWSVRALRDVTLIILIFAIFLTLRTDNTKRSSSQSGSSYTEKRISAKTSRGEPQSPLPYKHESEVSGISHDAAYSQVCPSEIEQDIGDPVLKNAA